MPVVDAHFRSGGRPAGAVSWACRSTPWLTSLGFASDRDGFSGRLSLTARELEIFTRLASGDSNREIARELSLSTNTVANHIASILAKLHLENRIQAAVHAVRSGIS